MNDHPFREHACFSRGHSYWRVVLSTGKVWSELDMVEDPMRGKRGLMPGSAPMRPVNWYLDLAATGDVRRITELWLHTPGGPVALQILEPGTAYQFSQGSLSVDRGREQLAQIIGRVDDKATGIGIAFVWDVLAQQVYRDDSADVTNFASWREGIAPPKQLALNVLGVTL